MAGQSTKHLDLKGHIIGVDSETTGLFPWAIRNVAINFGTERDPDIEHRDVHPARAFAWSFCDMEGNTAYLRHEVNPINREILNTDSNQHETIRQFWADKTITKVGHNIGFDVLMARMAGYDIQGPIIDTLILAHIVSAGAEITYALKPLCKKWFEFDDDDKKDLQKSVASGRRQAKKNRWAFGNHTIAGRTPAQADYWLGDSNLCKKYAIQDAERTMLLYHFLWPKLMADEALQNVFNREMKLFHVVARMAARGIRVYKRRFNQLRKFYLDYIDEQNKIANQHGGEGINLGSPIQLCKIFYDERKLTPMFTEKGNYSLPGTHLTELAKTDKLAEAVLELRTAKGMVSLIDSYERYWFEESPDVWVVRPTWRQLAAKTGRLSSSDPSVMNVADAETGLRKSRVRMRPREAFGPRPGHLLYFPDFKQMEVWVFASLAKEKAMMKALLSGKDYHGEISKSIFGKRPDYKDNFEYYRKCAKLLMFCKLYGGGVKRIASLLFRDKRFLTEEDKKRSPESLAQEFLNDYESELPGVRTFSEEMTRKADRDGFIRNPYGRLYHFDRGHGYKSVNYLIQGTSAEIMKNAMITVDKEICQRDWPGIYMILSVHDEIVLEVPYEYHSLELMKQIVNCMQRDSDIIKMPIPFPIDLAISTTSWSEETKIDPSLLE
jgi:DNA polymerase I-like protein with 3'-5' exonuclease and polymerase domains